MKNIAEALVKFPESLPGEVWKKVSGSKWALVSNLGRVWVKDRLSKLSNTKRYLRAHITYENGDMKSKKVHRLVAEAFLPNPNNLGTVNHKDFNPHNNNVDNLEWMSSKENIAHGKRNGRCMPIGIGEFKALAIYTFHMAKYPGRHPLCTKAFSISGASYEATVNGKNRKHLYKKIFGGIK